MHICIPEEKRNLLGCRVDTAARDRCVPDGKRRGNFRVRVAFDVQSLRTLASSSARCKILLEYAAAAKCSLHSPRDW